MEIEKQVLLLIDDVLALEGRGLEFTASTPLLGAVPELDSMAVIGIINALEEQFDFIIGDDEIDGETFETVGLAGRFRSSKAHLLRAAGLPIARRGRKGRPAPYLLLIMVPTP